MCFKAFTIWCVLAICVFGRSCSQNSSEICQPFTKKTGLQKLCGYNATARYDYFSHLNSAIRAVNTISRLLGSCSDYTNLIVCSVFIPRCVSNIDGPYLPCRRVCDEFNNQCGDQIQRHGLEWIIGMCQLLPPKDDPNASSYLGHCFEPPNFKTNISTGSKPRPLKCYPLAIPICQNVGYTHTVLNTRKQKTYIRYANRKLKPVTKDNVTLECILERKRFFCTENFPACINKSIAFYCRPKCEEFFQRNCSSPFFYDKTMCMEFPMGSSPVDICKQSHWPRAHNWPAVKRQFVMSTTNPTEYAVRRQSVMTTNPKPFGSKPTPRMKAIIGKKKRKMTPTGPIVGGVSATVFFIAMALIIGYVIYKKKQMIIPYEKQILYSEDSVEF